jgi:uncharacterized protein YqgV (UPF0045/DUF77 family)
MYRLSALVVSAEMIAMHISAQISVYPLRQDQLSPVIRDVQDALAAAGLQVTPGPMSTLVTGEGAAVFDALKASFLRAAATGHVVMTVTVSNACPI